MRLSFVRRAAVLLLVLPTSIVGCSPDDATDDLALEMESLYFEPIGYGRRADFSDTLEIAIRTQEAWDAYQDSLVPIAPFDSVDFSQVIVLLAALPQVTSGYAVEFASVDALDSVVVAEYVVSVPAEDCLTAYAANVPFQAILARRTDLPVRFQRMTEEYRCTFGPRRR